MLTDRLTSVTLLTLLLPTLTAPLQRDCVCVCLRSRCYIKGLEVVACFRVCVCHTERSKGPLVVPAWFPLRSLCVCVCGSFREQSSTALLRSQTWSGTYFYPHLLCTLPNPRSPTHYTRPHKLFIYQ